MAGRGRGVVLILGVVAHALGLIIPEAIRKKLEPMRLDRQHGGGDPIYKHILFPRGGVGCDLN